MFFGTGGLGIGMGLALLEILVDMMGFLIARFLSILVYQSSYVTFLSKSLVTFLQKRFFNAKTYVYFEYLLEKPIRIHLAQCPDPNVLYSNQDQILSSLLPLSQSP